MRPHDLRTSHVLALALALCAPLSPCWPQSLRDRTAEVRRVAQSGALTDAQKLDWAVSELLRELQDPTGGEPGKADLASGLAFTEHVQAAYLDLAGRVGTPDAVWAKVVALDGEDSIEAEKTLQKLLLMVYADCASRTKDPEQMEGARANAAPRLVGLLAHDPYDLVRAYCARALRLLQAREEGAEALIAALQDPAFRDIAGLSDVWAPGITSRMFLVRREAGLALRAMGYEIRCPDWETWELVPDAE